jgi:hypothetical protein
VTALALRPPGHILAHQIDRPTTSQELTDMGGGATSTRASKNVAPAEPGV